MANKVKIELRPYDALGILAFLREYVNEENKDVPQLASLHEMVNAYEQEVYKKTDLDMVEDAVIENTINKLTGRQPEK